MKLKKYEVIYLDLQGEVQRKVVIATSKDEVRRDLEQCGCATIKIKRKLSFRISRDDRRLIAFFRNLSNLLEAGYSVSNGLKVLIAPEKDLAFRKVIEDVLRALERGYSFSSALDLHPEWFSVSVRALIRSGEQSGNLLLSLREVASYLLEEYETKQQMKREVMPPALMFGLALLVMFFITSVVFPRLTSSDFFMTYMKDQLNAASKLIPITAKVIPLLLLFFFLFSFAFLFLYRNFQEKAEAVLMKVPLVGCIWFDRDTHLLYHALSRLLFAGVTLEQSLEVLYSEVRLETLRHGLKRSLEQLRLGRGISDELPLLDSVERALLRGSTAQTKAAEVLSLIAKRKKEAYLQSLKRLPYAVKALVYTTLVYLVLLTFFGIFVPYYKSASQLLTKLTAGG